MRKKLLPIIIGSGFGSGYWPWGPGGPGTAGSFLAFLIWLALSCIIGDPCLKWVVLLLVFLFYVMGVWASNRLEPVWGNDPSRIVIDEMVGVWINLMAVPAGNIVYGSVAFLLFRFFDIVKPLGIRRLEAIKGGHGIMMDDVLAGIYGALVILLFRNVIVLLLG